MEFAGEVRVSRVVLACILLSGCTAVDAEDGPATATYSEIILGPQPTLSIRVDHLEGRSPSSIALDELLSSAGAVTGKDVALLGPFVIPDLRADPSRGWTDEERYGLHRRLFDVYPHEPLHNGVPFLHVMYLDGVREGDEDVVGLSSGPEITIFIDRVRNEGSVPPPAAEKVERAVLMHEFGHSLGLVGCGIPMVKPRAIDGCHSPNERSVMHPSADDDVASALLDFTQEGGHIHFEFDVDDLEDIRAFRESFS